MRSPGTSVAEQNAPVQCTWPTHTLTRVCRIDTCRCILYHNFEKPFCFAPADLHNMVESIKNSV